MIFLNREEAFLKWDEYWAKTSKSFYKFEYLQDYGAEEAAWTESYSLWRAGKTAEAIDILKTHSNDWAKQVSEKKILFERIHYVTEPYHPYLAWEIEHYQHVNIPKGRELVYLVRDKSLPNYTYLGDFMIFDEIRVANSHYSKEGRLLSMDFYDEGEDISIFLSSWKELKKYSIKLQAA